jgi:hypothetical protein
MGIVKQYQIAIAELGGCAHAEFWGKHNRAPDTDDAGDVAELMRTAERIMRTAGWGWAEGVQRDAESEVVGWEDADERAMQEAWTKNRLRWRSGPPRSGTRSTGSTSAASRPCSTKTAS